jgi:hypothetical protein
MQIRKNIERKSRFDIYDFFFPFYLFLQGGKDTPALQYRERPARVQQSGQSEVLA